MFFDSYKKNDNSNISYEERISINSFGRLYEKEKELVKIYDKWYNLFIDCEEE